jgi:hypothetical protein
MGFGVAEYNKLLHISEADSLFEQQLVSAGITRGQLWSQLAPLFLEKTNVGRYAACLIHRHYLLKDGERMVTNGNSTRPSTDTSVNIVAERWLSTGQDIEYRFTDDPASLPPPPSANFLARFKSITDANGIDILGVCYSPPIQDLAPGFIFLEKAGLRDREQVITIVPYTSLGNAYQACWVARVNVDDLSPSMFCGTSCASDEPGCKTRIPACWRLKVAVAVEETVKISD